MSYGNLTDDQRTLADLMSDISQRCWCAGWESDLEFNLWRIVEGEDREYGVSEVTEPEAMKLRRLSLSIGGWITWCDDHEGETFVPFSDWLERYRKWLAWCDDREGETFVPFAE